MNQHALDFSRERVKVKRKRSQPFSTDPLWMALAMEFLKLYALRTEHQFTAENVVDAAEAYGLIRPDTDKRWGAVFLKSRELGIIERDGYGICHKRHRSVCNAWRSKIYGRKRSG